MRRENQPRRTGLHSSTALIRKENQASTCISFTVLILFKCSNAKLTLGVATGSTGQHQARTFRHCHIRTLMGKCVGERISCRCHLLASQDTNSSWDYHEHTFSFANPGLRTALNLLSCPLLTLSSASSMPVSPRTLAMPFWIRMNSFIRAQQELS